VELEVAGAGEFMCPRCGARNAVREPEGLPQGAPDFGFGAPAAPPPAEDPPGIDWVTCPSCRWRFAVGDVPSVSCPTCGIALTIEDGVASAAVDG